MDYKIFKDFSAVNTSLLSPNFSLEDMQLYLGEDAKFKVLKSVRDAFRTALQFCNVAEGDVVLVQSLGAKTALDSVLSLKATPILIDSEASNWNISAMMIEMVINQCVVRTGVRPKAVIVKHHLGVPAFMDEVMAVCKRHQIPFIEDCIGALGAKFEDKVCGTMGQYGIYSVANPQDPTNGLGVLVHAVPEFDEFLDRHLKHDQLEHTEPLKGGFSLTDWENELERRRQIYNRYLDAFNDVKGLSFFQNKLPYIHPSNAYSPLVIDPLKFGDRREEVINAIVSAGFAGSCPFSPSLNTYEPYKKLTFYSCRVGINVGANGFVLPSQPSLTDQNVDDIIQIVFDTLNKKK